MEPISLILIAIYAIIRHFTKSENKVAPQKYITIIGFSGVGKSSTANALFKQKNFSAGKKHDIQKKTYKGGYEVYDTPGLDKIRNLVDILEIALQSLIVVYVVNGQLYEKEKKLIREIIKFQEANFQDGKLLIYVNKRDIAKKTMTSTALKKEEDLILKQASEWVDPKYVVFGSASPAGLGFRNKAEIEELRTLIESLII